MVEDYLREFVRQSFAIEGIANIRDEKEMIRVHELMLRKDEITAKDVEGFVQAVEPWAKIRDQTGMDVQVGDHRAVAGGPHIPYMLESMMKIPHPWEFYCRYEHLHPFTDGNGRSGRALWLRKMVQKIGEMPRGLFLEEFHYQTLRAWDEGRWTRG